MHRNDFFNIEPHNIKQATKWNNINILAAQKYE